MFLRSVNEQLTFQVVIGGQKRVSVVYPGPPVQGALLQIRSNVVVLASDVAMFLGCGIRIVRLADLPLSTAFEFPPSTTGQRAICSWCEVADLLPGDVIEAWYEAGNANRVALLANGFSVLIR